MFKIEIEKIERATEPDKHNFNWRTIYTQEVEELDLISVINAVNSVQAPPMTFVDQRGSSAPTKKELQILRYIAEGDAFAKLSPAASDDAKRIEDILRKLLKVAEQGNADKEK